MSELDPYLDNVLLLKFPQISEEICKLIPSHLCFKNTNCSQELLSAIKCAVDGLVLDKEQSLEESFQIILHTLEGDSNDPGAGTGDKEDTQQSPIIKLLLERQMLKMDDKNNVKTQEASFTVTAQEWASIMRRLDLLEQENKENLSNEDICESKKKLDKISDIHQKMTGTRGEVTRLSMEMRRVTEGQVENDIKLHGLTTKVNHIQNEVSKLSSDIEQNTQRGAGPSRADENRIERLENSLEQVQEELRESRTEEAIDGCLRNITTLSDSVNVLQHQLQDYLSRRGKSRAGGTESSVR
eukprot:GHVL01033546.1.p2 GENE.GHVL01033546.1~~GHVL01033546.1.p2  ORF type:complete len:298 (+),score=56.69 GHVL01033546.1:35-928(+)